MDTNLRRCLAILVDMRYGLSKAYIPDKRVERVIKYLTKAINIIKRREDD